MNIHLLAVGRRMPGWVTQGYETYHRRLPRHLNLQLAEIAVGHRGTGASLSRAIESETRALERAASGVANCIALDERGKPWTTAELAKNLKRWMQSGGDVALLVGGPDGLDRQLVQRADARWSLGPLTLPHPLVRVIVAEQLYRAWTILDGHPYHRD